MTVIVVVDGIAVETAVVEFVSGRYSRSELDSGNSQLPPSCIV